MCVRLGTVLSPVKRKALDSDFCLGFPMIAAAVFEQNVFASTAAPWGVWGL
jgi:hypothetical protein